MCSQYAGNRTWVVPLGAPSVSTYDYVSNYVSDVSSLPSNGDASQSCYITVLYLRNQDGQTTVQRKRDDTLS